MAKGSFCSRSEQRLWALGVLLSCCLTTWAWCDDSSRNGAATAQRLPVRFKQVSVTKSAAPAERQPGTAPLRLAPPKSRNTSDTRESGTGPARAWSTTLTSLSIVIGVFLLVTWVAKRHLPAAAKRLSPDVVETLGRMSLTPRQELHLVRVGGKLVLLGSTPQGLVTLTEITEPSEVQRLERLCRPSASNAASSSFQKVLAQFDDATREPAWAGAAERPAAASAAARRPRAREVGDA